MAVPGQQSGKILAIYGYGEKSRQGHKIVVMPNENQCLVHYRPLGMRIALTSCSMLAPLVTVPLLFMLAILLVLSLHAAWTILFEGGSLILSNCLTIFALATAAVAMLGVTGWIAAVSGDDRISMSREGICFPLFMAPWLRLRRQRPWSDITAVELIDSGARRRWLAIFFKSGGHIKLSVEAFNSTDLETLLLACDVCAGQTRIDSNVLGLRQELKKHNQQIGSLSYTEMWEHELGQRFHATVFVPLEPDSRLQGDRLKIIRQLAFGGLSAIYLAQRDGRELMIVKEAVIPPGADAQKKAKAVEMFEREAVLLAGIHHPDIAAVLDHFVEGGRNYLVLEYINGLNLRQVVAHKGCQNEVDVLRWSRQIAGILNYLHNRIPPIIHRDLTPENLILKENGEIVLIDFGAANELLGTATGTIVGKQAYIAPEQFRGKASPQSDIYALGGTMHFLLTGQNPLALKTCRPKELLPTLDDATDNLVRRCTAQDQNNRPQSSFLMDEIDTIMNALQAETALSKN